MRMASTPGKAYSKTDLSNELGLSRNHLAKIMQQLSHGGMVETRRGAGGTDGGAALRASLQDIRWGQIILLLAEGQSLVACMAGARARARRTLESCWRLISRLHRAKASFIADLDLSTRADIALPVPETAG